MKASVNDYFRQNKVRILLFGLFTAFVSFLAPLKSFQLKWLIDSSSKNEAFAYLGLVFTITFASWLFELLSRRSFTKLACGAVEQVRNQVMECVLHRSVAQYNNESDAVYLSLLTTDLRTLYDDYYMSIFNVVFWGGIMLCALGLYLYISPILLVAILLVTIPPLVLPRIMNDQLTHARNKFSAQMAEYTGQLKELMGGFELIRAFLREDSYDNQHRVASHKAAESELTYQQSLNSVIVNTSLISNLIFPIVLLIGLLLVFDGRITIGTMSTAASMANFVITPCHQIAQCYAKIKSSYGIRTRLENAMSNSVEMPHGETIDTIDYLTCENVRFTYPEASKPILNGATLSINGQQKVAIVGESGCGKSTLAKLLFQYYPDYTGNILFNGRQVREISRQNFYKHVGYIAQSAYLFNDTIRNNICLLESFSDGQLRHAINSAGLTEWIASLPDGLDTMISENGKNLSGGQRQRIGIARLTLRKYDLIIADEITASLDPETSQQVMDNLLTMSCMVIAITHDVSDTFMQRFDKIYQISSGIITSEQRGV